MHKPPPREPYKFGDQIFRFHDEDGPSDGDLNLILSAPTMHDLLMRLADAVEALDGTSVENEKLVDDYRAWRALFSPQPADAEGAGPTT